MVSYVVTGASRGLGVRLRTSLLPTIIFLAHTLLHQLTFVTTLLDAGHTVIAIVRDRSRVSKGFRSLESQKPPNLHILEADMDDYSSLKVLLS